MKQLTLATGEFERFRKPTRREKFLAERNEVVPWADLVALIEPHYLKAGKAGGRPAVGLERMRRMRCLQLWFNLSDPVVDQLLHGNESRVYGDQAYRGKHEAICPNPPKAKDFINRRCKWNGIVDEAIAAKNRSKFRVRARVEHSIGVIKRVF